MGDGEIVKALKAGIAMPPEEIITLRAKGMRAIRTELLLRLLEAKDSGKSFWAYWEREQAFANASRVEDRKRCLVLNRGQNVIGQFIDLWLLCYPHDAEINDAVEGEIARMLDTALGDSA